MQRIPSAGTAISRAAAAEIPSRMHRPDRALAALAALPMSMRPRTQTAIIIARLRSKTARILHSIKNLFRLRRLLHRRIPYNPPPKRWRAHSHKPRLLEPESSRTPRAKPPCRPAPDVRRAMWQRRRTMQRPRQEKPRPARRIIMQELCNLPWAARSSKIHSRSRPYIPNRNPIRAAAHRYRITLAWFRSVRQENRQRQLSRAVLFIQPAWQETHSTPPMCRDKPCRANPRSRAARSCSRLNCPYRLRRKPRPEWRQLQTRCQASLLHRMQLPAVLQIPSAAQECQTTQTAVRCEICSQKLPGSAARLFRRRMRRAIRSRRQSIQLRRSFRAPAWQEMHLRRTLARRQPLHQTVRQERERFLTRQRAAALLQAAIPQELVRGHSNRAVRRIRQRPVRQERSARPSAGVIPSRCSRRRAFLRMETPRSRSRTMFQPSSPAARCSRPAERAWMAALQIGSIPHPQRRHLRQRRLPTAKLVRLRARPRGLMRPVRQNSALRSAQFPHKAAAQKSRYRRLAHKLLLFPPLLPNGRAGNRRPRLLWEA